MKISTSVKWLITFLCITFCASLSADDPYSGGYLGARVGYSYNQDSCMSTTIDCDKDDVGYGLFGGYDFNRNLAIELSFNDIGDSTAKYPTVVMEGELREADLALKLSGLLYKQTRIYGKIGAAYWEAEVTGVGITEEDSGTRPLLGAGIEFPLSNHWTTRLEYQYINQVGNDLIGHTNPHFVSLALVWNFSSRAARKPVGAIPAPEPQVVIVKPVPEPEPVTEQRIVIDEQLGGPLFEFDKAEIRNTAVIDPVVNLLLQDLALNVSIIGHTDARGSAEYNQRLSETRANGVAKYFRTKGVSIDRIKIFGMGEDQPVADNQTDEGRAKNRRVEFIITGYKMLP